MQFYDVKNLLPFASMLIHFMQLQILPRLFFGVRVAKHFFFLIVAKEKFSLT